VAALMAYTFIAGNMTDAGTINNNRSNENNHDKGFPDLISTAKSKKVLDTKIAKMTLTKPIAKCMTNRLMMLMVGPSEGCSDAAVIDSAKENVKIVIIINDTFSFMII
jgi:hypothetical protein